MKVLFLCLLLLSTTTFAAEQNSIWDGVLLFFKGLGYGHHLSPEFYHACFEKYVIPNWHVVKDDFTEFKFDGFVNTLREVYDIKRDAFLLHDEFNYCTAGFHETLLFANNVYLFTILPNTTWFEPLIINIVNNQQYIFSSIENFFKSLFQGPEEAGRNLGWMMRAIERQALIFKYANLEELKGNYNLTNLNIEGGLDVYWSKKTETFPFILNFF
jgi:hypothetical protein